MSGRAGRVWAVGVPIVVLLAVAVGWALTARRPTVPDVAPVPIPATAPRAEPTAAPVPSPAPLDPRVFSPTADYVMLAPSQVIFAPDANPELTYEYEQFAYWRPQDLRGPLDRRSPSGQWTNKRELWDSMVPQLRAEALSLGPSHKKPLWPDHLPNPSGDIYTLWSSATTQGRGDLVEVAVNYQTPNGEIHHRSWGALIKTSPDGTGRLIGRSAPLDTAVRPLRDGEQLREELNQGHWAWVQSQHVQ